MLAITKVNKYVGDWRSKGYVNDIPDEVPHELMKAGVAPSYKAIAIALLQNDMHLTSLGFSAPKSKWYSAFKRVEIEERERNKQKSLSKDEIPLEQ